jgi:hypothetical protein
MYNNITLCKLKLFTAIHLPYIDGFPVKNLIDKGSK